MSTNSQPVVKLTDLQKVEAVCAAVVDGRSLNKAVKEIFGDGRKFHEAITKNPELRTMKDAAMDIRADLLADEIVEISDSDPDPNRARNRIGARTWLAAKLKPRSYGERLELSVQHSISINEALQAARGRMLPESSPGSISLDAEVVAKPTLADGQESVSVPMAAEPCPDIFR